MKGEVIIDTGALVAYLSRTDRYHDWSREQFEALTRPLVTCEAVIAESTHLLRSTREGPSSVLTMLERGVVRIEFSLDAEIGAIRTLMDKYRDVPMSLADACLVRMAEIRTGAEILTLDGDFLIYRTGSRLVLRTRMPPAAHRRG